MYGLMRVSELLLENAILLLTKKFQNIFEREEL